MLTEKEKKEFSEKIERLKKNQDNFRKNLETKGSKTEDAERYKPIGIVYEFISMVLAVSIAGYFIGKATNSLPWTMIAFIVIGFTYSFYRLYKSVSKN